MNPSPRRGLINSNPTHGLGYYGDAASFHEDPSRLIGLAGHVVHGELLTCVVTVGQRLSVLGVLAVQS